MRILSKLVMLLALLAFCLPAHGQDGGEILIYNKTMKCFDAWGASDDGDPWVWDIDDERVRGYLILEVDFDGDEINDIFDAVQVEYYRDGMDRWYWQIDQWFDVERIEIEDRFGRPVVYWVLEQVFSPTEGEVWALMLRGKARLMNIGLGWDERKEVAWVLEGARLGWLDWSEDDWDYIWKKVCCVTLRLHPWWTRLANLYEPGPGDPPPFVYAELEIVKAWLEWLGYEEVDWEWPPPLQG